MAISIPLYTVDDLQNFPDDGNRYELLEGVLLVTPQAAAVHQIVANRIQVELSTALMKPRLAHVVGPGAVVRMPRTQLQPDILVYPARFRPMTDWRDEFVEVCTAKGESTVVRDTVRWRIAGVEVAINLREVFAGLA